MMHHVHCIQHGCATLDLDVMSSGSGCWVRTGFVLAGTTAGMFVGIMLSVLVCVGDIAGV